MKLVGNITSGKLTNRDIIGVVEPVNQWSHHKSVHLGVPEMLQGVRIICRISLAAIDFDTQHEATILQSHVPILASTRRRTLHSRGVSTLVPSSSHDSAVVTLPPRSGDASKLRRRRAELPVNRHIHGKDVGHEIESRPIAIVETSLCLGVFRAGEEGLVLLIVDGPQPVAGALRTGPCHGEFQQFYSEASKPSSGP